MNGSPQDRIINFYELFCLERDWDSTRLGVEVSRKSETKGELGEVAYGILSDESNRAWYDLRLDDSGFGRIPFAMLRSRAIFGDERHLASNPGMPVWPDGDSRNGPPPPHPHMHPHMQPQPNPGHPQQYPGNQMPPTASPFPTANPFASAANPYQPQNPYRQVPVGGPVMPSPGMAPGMTPGLPNPTANAEAGTRLGMRLVDFFIYSIAASFTVGMIPAIGPVLIGVGAPLWMAAFTSSTGASPAKHLFGYRVADNSTGEKLEFGAAFKREAWLLSQLLFFFPVLIFMGTIGSSISSSADNRGYHDNWANSRVTKKNNPEIQS